jgi:hypothetical protein
MNHSTHSRKHKRDAIHAAVVEVFKRFGFSVVDTSGVGSIIPGYPDLQVGLGGVDNMVEIKSGDKAPYTDAQVAFHESWRGSPIVCITSVKAAVEWCARTRHERRRQSEAKALEAIKDGRCVHRHGGTT